MRREVWTDDQLVSEVWETIPIPPELRPKSQDVKARAEAVTSRTVMATTGDEYLRWRNAVKKEHEACQKASIGRSDKRRFGSSKERKYFTDSLQNGVLENQ